MNALLAHANASPDTVENLFNVRAGIPTLGTPSIRGQSYPRQSKELWIREWRSRLDAARRNRSEAIRKFGPAIVAAYNDDSLWLPYVQLAGDQFSTSLRMRWSTTEAALWHALRLVLEDKQFYQVLGRCQHCGNFFLAKRRRRGRFRTKHCSDEHAKEHNEAVDRPRAVVRAREKRRRDREDKSTARRNK